VLITSSNTTLLYQCSRQISRSHPISRSTDLYLQIYRSVSLHAPTQTFWLDGGSIARRPADAPARALVKHRHTRRVYARLCLMGIHRKTLRRPPFGLEPLSRPAISKFSRPMRSWPVARARQRLLTCRVRDLLIIGAFSAKPARARVRTDLAGRRAAAQGLRATSIWRAASSDGLLATSFGGLQPYRGLHFLLADFSLLQESSLLFSRFPCSMFSHTSSFLGAYNISMHHTCMFCVCRPPTLFLLHFLLVYFSFLFLCAPLCAIHLEGY
jgi:hypothetical protein